VKNGDELDMLEGHMKGGCGMCRHFATLYVSSAFEGGRGACLRPGYIPKNPLKPDIYNSDVCEHWEASSSYKLAN